MKNSDTIQHWINGKNGRSGHGGSLVTDGNRLWHHDLLIGLTAANGDKLILNLTGKCRLSVSTSAIVREALRNPSVLPVVPCPTGRTSCYRREQYTFPRDLLISLRSADDPHGLTEIRPLSLR